MVASPLRLSAGSAVDLPLPTPLVSVETAVGLAGSAGSGLGVEINDGGLSVSASAVAPVGPASMTIDGAGCAAGICAQHYVLRVSVVVEGPAAPSGSLEDFDRPSLDRIASATEDRLPDEALVLLGTDENPGSREEAEAAAAAVGGVVSGGIAEEGIYQIRWSMPQDLTARLGELEAQPGVSASSPSYVGMAEAQSAYSTTVSSAFDQPYWTWRYDQVHAAEAWSQSTGSNVTVGVVDAGNVLSGSPELNVARTLNPIVVPASHATNVAGIACGKPAAGGMAGLAWGCPIVSSRVDSTAGNYLDADFMLAMQRVAKLPEVRVVNESLGFGSGCVNQAGRDRIEQWITHSRMFFRRLLAGAGRNIVWTFSAGNNCMYGPSSPWAANSDLPNVIDVAATNADGRLASFSNYGVDVAAPGGVEPSSPATDPAGCDRDDILASGRCGLLSSTVARCPSGYCLDHGEMAGTSMAAPVVAGVAALVASKHPSYSASQVASCITSTAGTHGVASTLPPDGQPGGVYANPPLAYNGGPIPIVNAAAAVDCASASAGSATAHGPTSGPAGFGLRVEVSTCTNLLVTYDGSTSRLQAAYDPSTEFDVVTPSDLPLGRHRMSFTCESTPYGEPTWTAAGFDIEITGAATALTLASDTVPAGEELVYTAGPSLSSTSCPSLPGVTVYGLSIFMDSGDGQKVVSSRFVQMPDGRSSEGLPVPADATPGKYIAIDRCYYQGGSGQVGV